MKNLKVVKIIYVILVSFFISTLINCKKETDEDDYEKCNSLVRNNQGYEVWAGDSAYFQKINSPDYFYNIDKYGYTLIGKSITTQTFNTGNFKYYIVVAKYHNCIDAIQFNDNTYLGDNNSGLHTGGGTEWEKIKGQPDGVYGIFGNITSCIGNNSNNGFITDDKTILSRGRGLTVIVGNGCQ
jgi:hypothetical protein